MAGNRIDMIERAAARLRHAAPSPQPTVDESSTKQPDQGPVPPPPNVVALASAATSFSVLAGTSVQPVTAPASFEAQGAAPIQPVSTTAPSPALAAASVQPSFIAAPFESLAVTPGQPAYVAAPLPVLAEPPVQQAFPAARFESPAASTLQPGPVDAESAPGVKTSRTVVLDTARLALAGTVDWTADRTPVMEELRLIKRRLLRRAFDANNEHSSLSHLVMISSAKPREGKTFVAINLAISISLEEDYNVLLVDADIRRQALRQNLGLEASQGFVDLLLNPDLDMADVLLRTNIPRLTVLPAGTMSDRAPELLASSRMRELIDDIARRYPDRIILFDTAPCLVSSDAATLAAHMGQVVFVVEAEETQQHEIVAALNLISTCPDISLILNKAQPLATTSYGGYGVY